MLSKRASHSDLKQIMEHFDKVINDYKFKLLDKYSNDSDMKIIFFHHIHQTPIIFCSG